MKTAIYIEDGIIQLVLTPESEFEMSMAKSFADKSLSVQVFRGSFYDCRGGWTRQQSHYLGNNMSNSEDASVILRIEKEKKTA